MKKLIFGFLAVPEIGFREMAFGKLDLGKTDIQENGFWEIGFRKNGLSGERNSETDLGRLISRFWAVTALFHG